MSDENKQYQVVVYPRDSFDYGLDVIDFSTENEARRELEEQAKWESCLKCELTHNGELIISEAGDFSFIDDLTI